MSQKMNPQNTAQNKKRYDEKLIVLTGATGILGTHYSRAFAAEGGKVVVADLDAEKCQQLAGEIREAGGQAVAMPVDLAQESSVCTWAARILSECGVPDILVNNAAAKSPNFFKPLAEFPLVDWNAVVAVNVSGIMLTCRELGAKMAEKGRGTIVNVSSIYGLVGPDQRIYEGSFYGDMGGSINTPLVYSATKGAVVAMTKYLATYWGHRGLRVNTLTPGGVESGQNEVFKEKYSYRVPLGRMGKHADMVGALLFLASDESTYINGHNLIVDGGWTAW